MKSNALRGAASALVLAIALTHAGPALTQEGGFGGQMVVTYKDDISTFDPAIGYDWQNWSMIKSLFDGLMDYKPGTTELIPDLAERSIEYLMSVGVRVRPLWNFTPWRNLNV